MKSERLIRLKLERLEESIKMPKANGFQLGVCDGKIQALRWVLGDEDYDSYDYGAQIRDYAVGGIFNSQWFKNYNDNKAVIMPKEEPTEQLNKLKESIKELQRTADELKKKIWDMESELFKNKPFSYIRWYKKLIENYMEERKEIPASITWGYNSLVSPDWENPSEYKEKKLRTATSIWYVDRLRTLIGEIKEKMSKNEIITSDDLNEYNQLIREVKAWKDYLIDIINRAKE